MGSLGPLKDIYSLEVPKIPLSSPLSSPRNHWKRVTEGEDWVGGPGGGGSSEEGGRMGRGAGWAGKVGGGRRGGGSVGEESVVAREVVRGG